jgi:hypothetical protein
MDLTEGPPRSPYETLGGIVTLPRCIDKMRAHLAGTAGEYKATTGNISTRLFEFLGVTVDDFRAIVAGAVTDAEVLAALVARRKHTPEAIAAWNRASLVRAPESPERWARHWRLLEAAGQGHRKDIRTVFDRLLAEDGVDVPAAPSPAPASAAGGHG